MKNLINLIVLIFLFTGPLVGQVCVNNPSIQQGDINPAPLINGQGGQLSLTYTENLLDYTEEENDPVTITICLLNIEPVDGVNSIGGSFYDHFDWVYDSGLNCVQGTQNQDIFGGTGGMITMDFVQTTSFECPDNQMGFNANIQPAACMNGVNETTDDTEEVYTCNMTSSEPELSISDYMFNEDAGVVQAEVCLSVAAAQDVELSYNMSDMTTSLGMDYASIFSGALNIAAGDLCTTIDINIVDDEEIENTETFSIYLFNPSNAIISDPVGVVEIIDNDVQCDANAPMITNN